MVPRAKANTCKVLATGTCFACSALVRDVALLVFGVVSASEQRRTQCWITTTLALTQPTTPPNNHRRHREQA